MLIASACAVAATDGTGRTNGTVAAKKECRSRPTRAAAEAQTSATTTCDGGQRQRAIYVSGPFRVVGPRHYRLDADKDGIAAQRTK